MARLGIVQALGGSQIALEALSFPGFEIEVHPNGNDNGYQHRGSHCSVEAGVPSPEERGAQHLQLNWCELLRK